MAYFKLHAYDADVWIREFRGLNQVDTSLNADPEYAAAEENVETVNGVLQPQAGYDVFPGPLGDESQRVETLAVFHRRWYDGEGSNEWYVCACNGFLYYKQKDSSDNWVKIDMPQSVASFGCNVWSWVTYEVNRVTASYPLDVLLISNAVDGMYMIMPPDADSTWGDLVTTGYTWGGVKTDFKWNAMFAPRWRLHKVDTRANPKNPSEPQKKFGIIERYGERIWGGAIPDEPDMLVYSRPYDPTDWSAAGVDEQPEDGAGDVLQPSWDGDKFFALKRFGDQLLAFKKNKIWRVMGLSPGEYTFHEQYGRGTEYFNTVAIEGERVFMMTRDGVAVFDGMNTTPYAKEYIAQIWNTVNKNALDQMCAVMYESRYYVAFPVNGSTVNNALIIFDLRAATILYYSDTYIESFLPAGERLYATSSSLPGQILLMHYDSWETGKTTGKPTRWESPWLDFGYKQIKKGGFEIYFTPEVRGAPMAFRFSIRTEKKIKTKTVVIQPTTFRAKQKRVRFGGAGRRFKLIVETQNAPQKILWRLVGGIQMIVETDPD